MPKSTNPAGGAVAALIVAAGRGSRAARDLPKQYVRLGGKTRVAAHPGGASVAPAVDIVQVVIGRGDEALYREAVGGLPKLLPPVAGGATRQQSVRNGLAALAPHAPRLVLVHDAARPSSPRRSSGGSSPPATRSTARFP